MWASPAASRPPAGPSPPLGGLLGGALAVAPFGGLLGGALAVAPLGGLLGGPLAVAPLGGLGAAMARNHGAELAAQAVEICERVIAADLEVGDHRLDLRPAALALIDRLSRLGARRFNGDARVGVASSSAAWRACRAVASPSDRICAHSSSAPRRSWSDSCWVVMRMFAVDLPTRSSFRATAASPISLAASVSSQSARRPRNRSTSCLS